MPIAIEPDHRDLESAARRVADDIGLLQQTRDLADGRARDPLKTHRLFAELGWTGIAISDENGGGGGSFLDLAVVLELLGASCSGDTLLASAVVSRLLEQHGIEEPWIDRLVDGLPVGVGSTGSVVMDASGGLTGSVPGVLCGQWAEYVAFPCEEDVALLNTSAVGVVGSDTTPFDASSGAATYRLECAVPELIVPGAAEDLLALLRAGAAAVASGVARAALDMAAGYARVREQFGRPIGSFQSVKNHLADMLIASEQCVALAWDAGRAQDEDVTQALLSSAFAAQATRLAIENAERCVQVHGGIGFTWEHDAHLFLRKAHALSALAVADDAATASTAHAASSKQRVQTVTLPPEAEEFRAAARRFAVRARSLDDVERRRLALDEGYLVPHWPRPWGRNASPVEQLVIEEELADIPLPHLGIGGWVLLTLSQHATPHQAERWVRPALAGDTVWCQLFSEPSAGSDAAAVRTRAERTDGGWLLTGQKVWTSDAQRADFGLATVRTDPHQPKHRGITTMVVDLHADGVQVRPIREMTGESFFNEVFLDSVFVPDDDVVGDVNGGWSVARSTLANERISIGGEVPSRMTAAALVSAGMQGDAGHRREVGLLLAEDHALAMMNLRQVASALQGAEPGVVGSVIKLAKAEHTQRVTALAVRLGGGALLVENGHIPWTYLMCRALTIAGGTSEITRTLIAERGLGMPREPKPN
jgi:alkylation response protein AidB-like acyl-CoA dehydrogenase